MPNFVIYEYCCFIILSTFPFHLRFIFVPIVVLLAFRFAFHWLESNRSYRFSMRTQMERKLEWEWNDNWNENERQMEWECWKNAGTTIAWLLFDIKMSFKILCKICRNLNHCEKQSNSWKCVPTHFKYRHLYSVN